MTLPAGPYLDGDGHLVLKATRSDGRWTSGRMESTRDDFAAPAGGELEMTASIQLPVAADARATATGAMTQRWSNP